MSILLGIDVGTGSVRVGAIDPDGVTLATGKAGHPTRWPRPGWAEQDPTDWWTALRDALNQALAGLDRSQVIGIGVSTTSSTVVILDEGGRPLRDAIVWMDNRAADEAELTERTDHPVMRYSGGGAAVEWLVPKAMWLARHEPEVYRRAHRIVEAVDYLNWRLTGRWAATKLNATCKLHYDPIEGRFPAELYEELGVGDLPTKWPEAVLPVGACVGTLTESVAHDLDLPAGVLVAEGGIDAHMGMLGMNAVRPGDVGMVAGTSVVHITQSEGPVWHPGIWGPYPQALLEDRWLIEGGQVSAGSILAWLTRLTGTEDPGAHRDLAERAAQVPAGAKGLLVMDFWQGNRTPYRDARLRGAVLGLSLAHGASEIYRACVEALAYGTANVLAGFADGGIITRQIKLSGGIRHDPLWLQVTADVLQQPVELMEAENATLRAGAIAAAVATGREPELLTASDRLSSPTRTIEPRPELAEIYQDGLGRYRAAVEALREPLHDAADRAEHHEGDAVTSTSSDAAPNGEGSHGR